MGPGINFTSLNPVTGDVSMEAKAFTVAETNRAMEATAVAGAAWSTLDPNARRAALTLRAGPRSPSRSSRVSATSTVRLCMVRRRCRSQGQGPPATGGSAAGPQLHRVVLDPIETGPGHYPI